MEGRGVEMSYLATSLSGVGPIDREVNDRTGLTGQFDFDMEWTPMRATDPLDAAGAAGASLGPSIFTAFEEQLGLRLRATQSPGDVFIIDRAERPSAN
jgi:uncharacterized protein (TIGR03435 family)